jgi:hypothetical protein
MGYSQTWLAVRGGTAETVLPQLGLRGTGKREEEAESPLNGAELAGDWYIVIANRGGDPERMLEAAPRLSAANDVVFGLVEEHVMASEASHWRGGRRVWRVAHDSQHGIEHLETEGDLPPQFEGIRAGFAKQQLDEGPNPNVDFYFSIPLELARSLTGYMHDEDMAGIGAEPYEVLEKGAGPGPSASKPWWKRLTGG